MRVRIVSAGESNAWILGKIAVRLRDELIKIGTHADIDSLPDPTADVNHHMLYLDYNLSMGSPLDTIMITHVDNNQKLEKIKTQLGFAKAGICMSRETMQLLQNFGIPAERLCFINPAHDEVIEQKKIVIGIATAVYADGRKREQLLLKIADDIDPSLFTFKIMGSGWEAIIAQLKSKGFEIEYFQSFDYDKYITLIKEWDYYLYMGQDEGSMGFVDALAAGVKTIVTPQGYHLDAPGGITHPFNTIGELSRIFAAIAADQKKLSEAVSMWTWRHYAQKHLEIWDYLLTQQKNPSIYTDGLNSLLNKTRTRQSYLKKMKAKYRIFYLTFSRFLHSKDKAGKIRRKVQN